jgi:hypothetical protein
MGMSSTGIPGSSLPKRVLMAISQVLAALARRTFWGEYKAAAISESAVPISRRARAIRMWVSSSRRTGQVRGRRRMSSGSGSSKSSATQGKISFTPLLRKNSSPASRDKAELSRWAMRSTTGFPPSVITTVSPSDARRVSSGSRSAASSTEILIVMPGG